MFDERLHLFGAKFPTAGSTVKADLAVEMHFLTVASWAIHILAIWLDHLSVPLTHHQMPLINAKYVLSAYQRREHDSGGVSQQQNMYLLQ
ncbi:MAG: hypothetical protein ACYSWW_18045 [Planctomycetota bacterium]|jgi:hypothetical protein